MILFILQTHLHCQAMRALLHMGCIASVRVRGSVAHVGSHKTYAEFTALFTINIALGVRLCSLDKFVKDYFGSPYDKRVGGF